VPGIGPADLGVLPAAARESGIGRLGQVHPIPAAGDVPHLVHPSAACAVGDCARISIKLEIFKLEKL